MSDVQTVTVPPEDVPGSFGRQARGEPPIVPQPPEQPNSPQALRTFDEGQSALSRQSSALSREYSNIPKQPTQLDVSKAPDQRDYQKGSMEFAQAMALVGAFTSAFVRRPGGASLEAFAGAIKGWQTGNQQAYENSMKQWEQNTKATIENNRTVLNEYKLALENRQLNIDGMMAQIKLTAAKYQDKLMYDAASSGNYTLVGRIYDMQQKALGNVQKASDVIGERYETQTNANKELAQKWAPYVQQLDSMVNPKTGQPFSEAEKAAIRQLVETYPPSAGVKGAVDMTQVKKTAELMYEGKIAPPSAWTLRTPYGQAVTAELQRLEQERGQPFDPGKYGGTVAAARVTASAEPKAISAALTQLEKQRSAITSFENTAVRNGDVLVKLAEKVDQTGVPVFEKWLRAGKQASGDPEVATFHAQIQLYRAEVAKILTNPNMTGVLTDSARRETENFLSGAASAKQLKAVVQLLKGDFERRTSSIDDEIKSLRSRLHGEARPETSAGGIGPAADPLGIR